MYQLNQSKNAVIAAFAHTDNAVHKIETLFPEKVKGIPSQVPDTVTAIIMNTTATDNAVHKIETLFPEKVKGIPTYEKVIKDMEEFVANNEGSFLGSSIFIWLSEYSERNHARMTDVVSLLCSIEEDYYDEDFAVPKEDRQKIFDIGCDIDREGGFAAQQACYYIARNFLAKDFSQVKALELCWSGAGSWMY
jgi:hypothetical protein